MYLALSKTGLDEVLLRLIVHVHMNTRRSVVYGSFEGKVSGKDVRCTVGLSGMVNTVSEDAMSTLPHLLHLQVETYADQNRKPSYFVLKAWGHFETELM